MIQELPSKLLESAVNEFAKLPGIGKKTALRLVLHMLKQNETDVEKFGTAIINLRSKVNYCGECHNISDEKLCGICIDRHRDRSLIMVVEDLRDVIAIEHTMQYRGIYHVLGGILSPLDGIGPSQLNIESLIIRAGNSDVNELILALNTTMEGDTTAYYLYKKLESSGKKISTIARGVAIGGELEYADEVTLGRSIVNRMPYSKEQII
jgi:recombination protein RecR